MHIARYHAALAAPVETTAPDTDRAILIWLAAQADDGGVAHLSTVQIAKHFAVQRDTVAAALRRLASAGLVALDLGPGRGNAHIEVMPAHQPAPA